MGLRGRVVAPKPSCNSRRIVPPKRTTFILLVETACDSIREAVQASASSSLSRTAGSVRTGLISADNHSVEA